MHSNVKAERFRDLVCNPQAFGFARQILTESYVSSASGYESDMQDLMERAFAGLAAAGEDESQFQAAVGQLRDQVFRKQEPDFWFNRLYSDYKRGFKPQRRFQNLRPWLLGQEVLDLGCGDGLTSLVLNQNGYRVYLTDVLDYRSQAARDLPFAPMAGGNTIPYPGRRFDTALVFAVLHHVEAQDLLPLLTGLHRASRRVIIEEDCYMLSPDLDGLAEVASRDSQLQAFLALSPENQLRYLMFVDYFANAITQGLTQMDIPFNFRTVEEWQVLFEDLGFRLHGTRVMGFQKGFFNRSCHVWFALDAE